MRLFKEGCEIRLTQNDLNDLIEEAMNKTLFCIGSDDKTVVKVSLHPGTKYVARVTVETKQKPPILITKEPNHA